jgi:hypothetical protein
VTAALLLWARDLWDRHAQTIIIVGLAVFLIALAIASTLLYGHVRYQQGRVDEHRALVAQRKAWRKAYDDEVAASQAVTLELRRKMKEDTDGLAQRLEVSRRDVADLARRVRIAAATARGCPTPGNPTLAGSGPDGGGDLRPGGGDIERDTDAVWIAAAGVREALGTCTVAYERARLSRR